MRIASKEDRDLNDQGRPAIKKIGMLRRVMHNLSKVEMKEYQNDRDLLHI